MAFNLFPFTNLHNLNTDWILKTVKECKTAVENALAAVQTALSDAVLYTSQSKTASEQRTACGNINAVSYLTQGADAADRTVARTNIRAVAYEEQSLTDQQKAQARTNIGAISSSDIPSLTGFVSYTEAQSLTDDQKAQAQTNIGAASTANLATLAYNVNSSINSVQSDVAKCVKIIPQSLTPSQQAQALINIGAAAASTIPDVSDVLRYSSQSLTDLEKLQAQRNIDAMQAPLIVGIIPNELGTGYESSHTLAEISAAILEGKLILLAFTPAVGSPTYYGFAIRTDSGFYAETTILAAPTGALSSIMYYISMISENGSDVLTVTETSFRTVPVPQIGDTGKIFKVAQNGRPGWAESPAVITDTSSTTPTIATAVDDTIYKFTQDLTSLSLTAGSGSYMICFHSGTTPTTTSFPVSILGLDDFVPEADTYYEINVMDGRAVWMGWADPAAEE